MTCGGRVSNPKSPTNPDVRGFMHDVRSPLSVIKSFLGAVPVPEDDLEELYCAAVRSMEKVLRLLDDLKAETDCAPRAKREIDVASAVRSSIEGLAPVAGEKGVELRYAGPDRLVGAVDAALVDRVVGNLIVNAVQASGAGDEVLVNFFARDDVLFIDVADGGCGIGAEHLPRIFKRGFTRGKRDGSGIGLDVCKRVVEDHGGTIDVHSRKGEGTVFTVAVPGEWVPSHRPHPDRRFHSIHEETLD